MSNGERIDLEQILDLIVQIVIVVEDASLVEKQTVRRRGERILSY